MKRCIMCILCLIFLLSVCGCSKMESLENPVLMYYCNEDVAYNSPDAVISHEVHNGPKYETDPLTLLRLYLKGPNSQERFCPIPADVIVIAATQEESVIKVVFSRSFAQLSGIDLTLACVCVSETLMANYPVTSVEISAMDSLLDGQFHIKISKDDFILIDETLITEE